MPVLDKPLSELERYLGINPCPADIDEFWDKALEEMNSVDPQIELIPAKFSAPDVECFDLWFTGTKGARIYAKYMRPKNSPGKHPTILQFHGYTGNSGDWTTHLAYAASGFCIAAMDCRGQGGKSQDTGGHLGNTLDGHIVRGIENDDPNMLMFRDVFLDTAMLARVVSTFPEVDGEKLAAKGGSQGGALTLACASLVPQVKVAAPQYPFLCDYKRVWEMDLDLDAYRDMRQYFRRFDPRHENEDRFFELLGYIDLKNIAHRIKGKVIMFTGLLDNICPPSTQFAAYNRIVSEKVHKIYPDYAHETLPQAEDITYAAMLELLK